MSKLLDISQKELAAHDLVNEYEIIKGWKNPDMAEERRIRAHKVLKTWADLPPTPTASFQTTMDILSSEQTNFLQKVVEDPLHGIRINNPEKKQPEEKESIIRLGERILQGVPEIKWTIQDLVPDRGITIWGGASGSYKTFAAMEAALAVSTGTEFLTQYPTSQNSVLYIDEENGDKTLISRFNALMHGKGLKPEQLNDVYLSIFHNIKLDHPQAHLELSNLIKRTGAKLVIIDSMVRCMKGEEDKSRDVRLIFETLKQVMEEHEEDVSFIILHHTTKAIRRGLNSLRGSGDFSAFADIVLIFDGHKGYALVEQVKNRHLDLSTTQPFLIKLVPEGTGYKLIWLPQNEAMGLIQACADSIKNWYTLAGIKMFQTKQANEAAEKEGYKHNTINSALKILMDSGDLTKQQQGIYKVVGVDVIEDKIQDD